MRVSNSGAAAPWGLEPAGAIEQLLSKRASFSEYLPPVGNDWLVAVIRCPPSSLAWCKMDYKPKYS